MSVRKVVVPVAGLGTRLLPTTKALPKEMLPLGKYPAIQLVVEEMVAASLKKILFVTSRSKTIIENQFDNNQDVVIHLEQSRRLEDLGEEFDYSSRGIEFFYTRQQTPPGTTKPRGTAEAVATAESFVDDEHFAVAYGDAIIRSDQTPNFIARMIDAHLKHKATCTIGVRPVPEEQVNLYGIVEPVRGADMDGESFQIQDIVEKPPRDEAPSQVAVSARYVFGPEIFDEIRKLTPMEDGELNFTDAIRSLIRSGQMVRCVQLGPGENRYDIGSHESYYKAFIDFALQDPDCADRIREYLQQVLDSAPDKA